MFDATTTSSNVFIISYTNKLFIVYLPLQGILLKANATAVNHFYNALNGDLKAQLDFGLTTDMVSRIFETEEHSFPKNEKELIFRPTSVSLFLTGKCSMRCTYCYASAGESNIELKKEFIEVAIAEIINNALFAGKNHITVNYHGGGDIGAAWELVEETTSYIKERSNEAGIESIISTGLNGVLSDYQRRWIVDHINSATVSIDGYEEIQNMQRPLKNGKPSFGIVHDTLKYFDKQGFNYAIRSTATSDSIRELEKIVTFFCKNYKVRKIKVEPVYIQGRALKNGVGMPSESEFVKFFLRAQKIAESFNRSLLYSGARFDVMSNMFCMAAGSSFGVTPEGYITSCYEVLEKSNPASDTFFYGKIENSKIEIFPGKLEKLASLTVENKEKCQKCFARFHCAGDCPVKAYLSEKDEKIRDYRCTINRELTKHQLIKSIS
jgi:uncharacterized protein